MINVQSKINVVCECVPAKTRLVSIAIGHDIRTTTTTTFPPERIHRRE